MQKIEEKLPVLKSDDDIKFYLEHGPKFGNILRILNKEISSMSITEYSKISKRFKQLCRNTWKNYKIKFPFVDICNGYGDKFSKPICVSINDTIAHGLDKKINKGDIVSIDCGLAIKNKKRYLNFDAAFTTHTGIWKSDWIYAPALAINKISRMQLKENTTTANISFMIESTAKENNLNIVVSVTGHGIGRKLHEPPYIHNALGEFTPQKLINNMCFCVEPIFVLPAKNKERNNISKVYIDSDGWSIKSESGRPGSHFETMFCVYKNELVDLIGISNWG